MNLYPGNFKLPARDTIAGVLLLALFGVFALLGLASLLYGCWLFSHPGAFLAAGVIFLVIGCLGLLGRSGSKQEEPW